MGLGEILKKQASLVGLDKYENELETMRYLAALPKTSQQICRLMSLDWINSLNGYVRLSTDPAEAEHLTALSDYYRDKGNAIFKKKNRCVLEAAYMYTKAILTAPGSISLALAHANRAAALREYGYYQEAYDDCVCALETNYYPENLLQKLILRQAFCASELGDATRLREHLDALDAMPLKENMLNQIAKLRESLEALLEIKDKPQHDREDITTDERPMYQMVTSNDYKGRHMIATEPINPDQFIFRAPIYVITKNDGYEMCEECASTYIIPFPCKKCAGRVVYCSLKCLNANANIHQYECQLFNKNIPANIGLGQLVLRTFLTGLPDFIILIKHFKTLDEIWLAITDKSSKTLHENLNYVQTLKMITHLKYMKLSDIKYFALLAQVIVLSLKEYSTIFEFCVSQTNLSTKDWELLIGAILLRHFGQMIANGHAFPSLIPETDSEFVLFCPRLWKSPKRLRCGELHNFHTFRSQTAMNIPLATICNHSCKQQIRIKVSGRYIDVFAVRPIASGEEIWNTYVPDARKSLWDLVALKKVSCSRIEMERMLSALDIASDEVHDIFYNYYLDYIIPVLENTEIE